MSQNALSRSDCRILKSAFFQEKIDESTWFLPDRKRFNICKRWFVNFKLGRLKMLSPNQIAWYLNQLYLKQKAMNQFDFWYAEIFKLNLIKNAFSQSDWKTFLAPNLISRPATMTQSVETAIPPNRRKVLGLSCSKIKWWVIYMQIYQEMP